MNKPPLDINADLWDAGFFRINRAESDAVSRLREVLRDCPNKLGPYIADVRSKSRPGGFEKRNVSQVESFLVAKYGKSNSIVPLRILKSAVYHLNREYEKCIPTPTLLDRLRKDPNLLEESFPAAQRRVTAWLEAEKAWLDSSCVWFQAASRTTRRISWQMVIGSAGLRGGILDVSRAVALAEATADPKRHFACSEIRGYADLLVSVNNSFDRLPIRWYPDECLLLLLSRVVPEEVQRTLSACSSQARNGAERSKRIEQAIFEGIHSELYDRGVDRSLLPSSLADFLFNIELFSRSQLPSAIVDFAAGTLPSRTLLPWAIGWVHGDPTTEAGMTLARAAKEFDGEVEDVPEAYGCSEKAKEPLWALGLRRVFCCANVLEACAAISNLLEQPGISPAGKQLCTLTQKLLTGTSYSGNRWALSSVRCCILTVMRRFAIQRGNDDPAGFLKATLEELYLLALDEVADDSETPARLRRTVAWSFREYQRHIVCNFGAPPVNEAVAFHVDPGLVPISASVISIDDLFRVVDHIEKDPNPKWSKTLRCVAIGQLIIMFLGGLRRMEGLGLDPADFMPGSLMEILVRPNDHRDLKTPNSERRVLLYAFAHPFPELLDKVLDLYEEAKCQGGDFSCGISEDVIVPLIHDALKSTTGDDNCHLHNLRHSAAHWMFLRLSLSGFDTVPVVPQAMACRRESESLSDHRRTEYAVFAGILV